MKHTLTIVLMSFALIAQAQTSNDNPKLKEGLKRFPQADANGDGVLTLEEARAFKQKADKADSTDDGGSGIKSSYIYKTMGKKELPLFVDVPKGHTANAKAPAIVFFHGGGFKSGSEKAFERQAQYLADRGMVAIRVRYRLISQEGVEVTDCIEDAISSMRWVRANASKLGVDPDRIAAGGGSAGGYLSLATLLVDFINAKTDPAGVSAKPNALVLFNPGFGGKEKDGKPDPRDPEGKYKLANYVKPGAPPTIIFHGTADKTVPFATAEAFTAVMKSAGNRCELIGYEGAGHSFFSEDKYYQLTIAETDKFLVGLGWLENKLLKNKKQP
jgi:acetyl esterase